MSRNRRGTGLRSRADQGGFLEQAGGLLDSLRAQPIQGSRARFGGDPGRTPAPEAPAPEAPAPSVADRAYMEEASRLTQQADPYMTAAMGVQANVPAAFGKPMPQRDYADEKDGLMGILNQMEEENLKNMGYGPAPAMVNLGQSTAGGAAAANMTQAAETAEAAGNLQPQVPLSPNYTGFPGRQPVTQGFADGLSLDMADGVLAELEQSRNNPNRDFRGNNPALGM